MSDADRNPIVSIDPQYFPPGEVVERPPPSGQSTTPSGSVQSFSHIWLG